MIPGSDVGGAVRASSAEAATLVTEKRGSMEKIASMRNCTSGSSSITTRILANGRSVPLPATFESPLVMGIAVVVAVWPSQGLDLLLELDHLQSAVDGHSLEPLELAQACLLLGQLLGDLPGSLHLFGHVSGGSKHAKHLSYCVKVDRGVVPNLGESPVPVPHGQRVVERRSFLHGQRVDPVRFFGVCEVLGEAGPDELVAGDASDRDGGVVDIGDLAVGVDRDQ